MNNPFSGVGVALVTPFKKDMSIDFDALRKLVQLQILGGTNFLVVQGTTGESPTLSQEEKMEILKTVIDENSGKLKVVYGLGGNNTHAIGELLKVFLSIQKLMVFFLFHHTTINQHKMALLSILNTFQAVQNYRLSYIMFLEEPVQIC